MRVFEVIRAKTVVYQGSQCTCDKECRGKIHEMFGDISKAKARVVIDPRTNECKSMKLTCQLVPSASPVSCIRNAVRLGRG